MIYRAQFAFCELLDLKPELLNSQRDVVSALEAAEPWEKLASRAGNSRGGERWRGRELQCNSFGKTEAQAAETLERDFAGNQRTRWISCSAGRHFIAGWKAPCRAALLSLRMQQTGVNLLPAVFHVYFLTMRLLYFNMLRFQSSVTGNCIVCYVSRSRASSWRRWFILLTDEATSGIACPVLGFCTHIKGVDKLERGSEWEHMMRTACVWGWVSSA